MRIAATHLAGGATMDVRTTIQPTAVRSFTFQPTVATLHARLHPQRNRRELAQKSVNLYAVKKADKSLTVLQSKFDTKIVCLIMLTIAGIKYTLLCCNQSLLTVLVLLRYNP